MSIEYIGELDGLDGVAERGGEVVAEIELRDGRERHFIEVPMPGGAVGKKPGRVTGYVAILFPMVSDPKLEEHLREIVERTRRTEAYEFDLVLADGKRIGPCRIGGAEGSSSAAPGRYWFTLEF